MSCTTRHGGLTIGVLGTLDVIRHGQRQALPASRKVRGLLAYLALQARPVARQELCDLLWDDVADPRGELRWSLAKLRAALGSWLLSSRDGIRLAPEGLMVDATAFRRRAAATVSTDAAREALALWRGQPLADADVPGSLRFHAWWAAEQEALCEIHRGVLHDLVDRLWPSPGEALVAARQLVAHHPTDEWGHARVSQALQRMGRTDEASAYTQDARRALGLELGLPAVALILETPAEPHAATAAQYSCSVQPVQVMRPLLGVMPLRILPEEASLQAIGTHLTAELARGLWRTGVCEVAEFDSAEAAQGRSGTAPSYAVRGSLIRLDDGLKLSLRCENAPGGSVLWYARCLSHRFTTRQLAGWLDRAVGGIQSSIQMAEIARVRARSGQRHHAAHDLIIEAHVLSGRLEPDANGRALALLDRVLTEIPDDARALSLAAWCHAQRSVYNWTDDAAGDCDRAEHFATAASLLGPDDPTSLAIVGTARTLIGDHSGADVLLRRALQFNPYSSFARSRMAWLATYSDQPDRAAQSFREAMQIAPLDPATFNSMVGLGVAHFIKGDLKPAIAWMEKGVTLNPRAVWAYRNLVPAYAAAGKQAEAERGVRAMLGNHPALSVAEVAKAMVFSRPTMERISDGLFRAGLPLG